ncbi:MAG: NADPH-dependent 7-cyano-7-deazaguanine reductase QueF [Bdellovibrionales bacterium]|nr:NADPH-dependent 7-cyano-7-deazaguanine reductase QueF [Bdellovibrionales bacterium]
MSRESRRNPEGSKSQSQKTTLKNVTLSNVRPNGKKMIREAKLLRFANRTTVRRYDIEFTCPEFTCICPVSGFPDFATITIKYVPKDWCVELKSLKLYFNQFRDQGIFHEDVSNRILDDLVKLLDPWEMEVVGDFAVRGNIKTIVRAKHKHPQHSNLN